MHPIPKDRLAGLFLLFHHFQKGARSLEVQALSHIIFGAYIGVAGTLFLLAKALRSQGLSERAAHMDPMNPRAVASLAPGQQLEIENFVIAAHFTAAEDKRRYAYVLTPKGVADKAARTKRFLPRKMDEYKALKAEIDKLSKEVEGDDAHRSRRGM